ncbi:MAG TPA: signal peptidase I [Blastocatellia bacterium]|jgi:signal peptidase I|nr:signal peptidase I [Blastocatellia bacterium]
MRAYDSIKAERGREVSLETPDFLEQARQMLSRSIPVEIRMSGSSMRPAIEDGDVITIEPVTENSVRPGDVILYQTRYDTAVIHRVIRIEKSSSDRTVVTRGDASSQTDIPVPLHRVIGQVKLVERAGERIKMVSPKSPFTLRLLAFLHRLRFWSNR